MTGLLVRTGGEPHKKPTWLLEYPSGSFLLRIRSSTSEVESDLYNGNAPFALGLALFTVSTAYGMRVARRGWGQMTSARGVGGESIGQNLDLLSGIASALERGCLK